MAAQVPAPRHRLAIRFIFLYDPLMPAADLAAVSKAADALGRRQRWLAAEHLAAGDPVALAAAAAGTDEDVLEVLQTADQGFRRLIDACRHIQELPRAEWRERAERLLRGAAERALADGRVSTVNLVMRATGALEEPCDEAADEPAAADPARPDVPFAAGPLAHLPRAYLGGLSREQLVDYLTIEDRCRAVREEAAAPPALAVTEAPAAPEPTPVAAPASPIPAGLGGASALALNAGQPAAVAAPAARAAVPPDPLPTPFRHAKERVPDWHRRPNDYAGYRARAP